MNVATETRRFDCIVAGLGAAGSAALFHLAASGARVAGFDAHRPPHTEGSSHGETRMIREAYFEDACYVPLVRRAYELWHALGAVSEQTIIEETGGVFAGPSGGALVSGIREAARAHDIAIRDLTAAEHESEPAWLRPGREAEIVTEPRAGLLFAEHCIEAHLDGAARHGAALHTGMTVTGWEAAGGKVQVTTSGGRFVAERLVVAMGPWMVAPLAAVGVELRVARQPLFWFAARDPETARAMPVWGVEFEPGRLLYGFPDRGRGLKVAIHDSGTVTTPEWIDRTVHAREIETIRTLIERHVPGEFGEIEETATCMYTNTSDGHFIIDTHPEHPNVLLVSACSGHGFKFASAIGEAAAQWMLDGRPALDLAPFSLERFGAAG